MDFIGMLAFAEITVPELNFVGKMIAQLGSSIGTFALTVVCFTLILKAITLPVEIWQRFSAKKNANKLQFMKPLTDKIDKVYASNPRAAMAEKQKVYKKHGYSALSGCIPTLLTLGLFIVMWGGLTSYSNFMTVSNLNSLTKAYNSAYNEVRIEKGYTEEDFVFSTDDPTVTDKLKQDYDLALKAGSAAAVADFNRTNESFFWVKNIWRPDTWTSVMPTYQELIKGSIATKPIGADQISKGQYEVIREAILKEVPGNLNSGWNGLLILPLLAVLLSFVSTKMTTKVQGMPQSNNKNDPTAQTQKTMLIMMPLMMGFFVLSYTAGFGLYIVTNSVLTMITTLLLTPVVNKLVPKQKSVDENSYRR